MSDFAIAPRHSCGHGEWSVIQLTGADDGRELAAPIASFGERMHAEAFLRDLICMVEGGARDLQSTVAAA